MAVKTLSFRRKRTSFFTGSGEFYAPNELIFNAYMAEREGFEPSIGY